MFSLKKLLNHRNLITTVNDVGVRVKRGVFNPDPEKTYSTKFLLDVMPHCTDKTVLDVGCGSGIVSIYSALEGAKYVLAVDNNRKAVLSTKKNVNNYNLANIISTKQSDLFDGVEKKYDLVLANLPISEFVWNCNPRVVLERFMYGVHHHVKSGGEAYFTWASFGAEGSADKLISAVGYSYDKFETNKLGHDWFVYKLKF